MGKQKNLGINYIYSVLKTLMGVVFPLITFPYANRIIGKDNIGKIDFAFANVSYFTLIAAFGISAYAIREGSKYRDDREKISNFASELICINIFTVAIAILAFTSLFFIPKTRDYSSLMLIFSVSIVLTPFGVEWIYNIFEEYRYITLRAFIFQVISVVILFTMVKKPEDYYIYAVTIILSSVGSNILNIIRLRKYIDFKFVFKKDMLRHVKPMSHIFVMTAAATVYLVMDRTMLGWITDSDSEVGLYTTAIKIVTVINAIITSVKTVVTPRSAYYVKSDPKKSEELNYVTLKIIYMLAIPCAIGIALLSDRIIYLFAGADFTESGDVLKILMIDLVFAVANGVLVNQFLVINKKDRLASVSIVAGAVTNLILNSIMIPRIGKYGAAISTCVSELVICIIVCVWGRSVFKIEKALKQVLQSLFACIPIIVIYFALDYFVPYDLLVIAGDIILGGGLYFVVLIILKNELVKTLFDKVLKHQTTN